MQHENTVDQLQDTTKKDSLRPLFDVFLFIAFLASLAIYFNQDAWFSESNAVKPATKEAITVEDLLLNKTGLIDENVDRFLNEVSTGYLPSNAIDPQHKKFIDESFALVISTKKPLPKNIHIYELVDYEKRNAKVALALKEANDLFKEDKLTTPKYENAFSKYEHVLALDPNNKEAIQGIQNIVNRYVYFIEKVIRKRENYKVPILIESARNVGENYVNILPIVEKYKKYLSADDLQAFYHQKTKDIALSKTVKDDIRYASNKIVEADYKITQVAMDLIKDNHSETALRVLSDFVALYPGKSQAYDLLLQLYLDQDDVDAAEKVIYQNVQFESVYLAEKAARVFIARDDYAGALSLLESHQAEFSASPDYYYLLAGLYVKSGSYDKAQTIYEKLIVANRYNAYYWFGLAMALQAKGDELAIRSFSVAKRIAIKDSLIDRFYQYVSVG